MVTGYWQEQGTLVASPFTHPDIASLVTPLFAFGGKRGLRK
jgi:hypothetical protein